MPGIVVKVTGLSLMIMGLILISICFDLLVYRPLSDEGFKDLLKLCILLIAIGAVMAVYGFYTEKK